MRVLKLSAVINITGLGRDSIYRGGREGWFPKPVKLGERASGWLEDEVEEFLARCRRQRDERAKPPRSWQPPPVSAASGRTRRE